MRSQEIRGWRTPLALAALMLPLLACRDQPGPKGAPRPARPATQAPAAGPSPPASPASFEEPIRFDTPALPSLVTELRGFGVPERWGRWTIGPVATIKLSRTLPMEFDLVIRGTAYRANVGQPVAFTVGDVTRTLTFQLEMEKGFETLRTHFKLGAPADRIEMRIPKPTVPPPETGDSRPLGIAVRSITIVPTSR